MKVALIHTEFRQSHLEKVMEQMQELGPPEIRAVWCEDRGFWAALEGCHRCRAASKLRLEPIIVPIDYAPGMKWKDVGMAHDYIAGAITLDQVIEQAGREIVIGFGEDALPLLDEVRRPQPGEIMKYRIIQPINFDFGGRVVGGVGTEFTTEDSGKDMADYVSQGFLEIVDEKPVKKTKEPEAEKKSGRRTLRRRTKAGD
jgi:hypothetical protein